MRHTSNLLEDGVARALESLKALRMSNNYRMNSQIPNGF